MLSLHGLHRLHGLHGLRFGVTEIQLIVCIRLASSSRGTRQLVCTSCLTSAGRLTLASGTTFLY